MKANAYSMRDIQDQPVMAIEPTDESPVISPVDEKYRSFKKNGNLNPGDPRHAEFIKSILGEIESGLVSKEGVKNLAILNVNAAPMFLGAYSNYLNKQQKEKEVQGIVGRYINEGKPEVPAQPEKQFQTTEEQAFGMPSLRGNVEQYAKEGVAAVPARADYQGTVNALAPKYPDLAEKYQKLGGLDKKKTVGYYGGVQSGVLATDKKTVVPWTIDEATGKTVRLDTGQEFQLGKDVLATTPMGFQTVLGPGGVNQIVQIPSRGIPGSSPTVTGTGLQPDKNFTTETAGKLRMVDQGMADIERARALVFDGQGKLKKSVLFGAKIPGTAGVGEESRMLYSAVENAVSAKYRAETGAAGNAEEVKSIAKRFTPTILDSEKSAADKLDRLEEFLSSTYDLVDPSKTYPRVSKRPAPRGSVSAPVKEKPKSGVSKEDIMKEIQKRRAEGRM